MREANARHHAFTWRRVASCHPMELASYFRRCGATAGASSSCRCSSQPGPDGAVDRREAEKLEPQSLRCAPTVAVISVEPHAGKSFCALAWLSPRPSWVMA